MAQPPGPPPPGAALIDRFNQMLGRGRGPAGPPVAHYVAEGVAEFTFDQTGGPPLVQFQGSREILALTPQPAPRGDLIFKNDVGDPVLRFSRLGGLTVYTSAHPEGAPAALVGMATPIKLQGIQDAAELFGRERLVSRRISRVMQRDVEVDVPDIGPESWTLVADVINLAADAFEKSADRIRHDQRLPHMDRLLVVEGDKPDVQVNYDTVQITVAPARGAAGRPSSVRIARTLTH